MPSLAGRVPPAGQPRLDWWASLHDALVVDAVRLRRRLAADGWSPDDVDGILVDYRAWLSGMIGAAVAEAAAVTADDQRQAAA